MVYILLITGVLLSFFAAPAGFFLQKAYIFIILHMIGVFFMSLSLYRANKLKLEKNVFGPATCYGLVITIFFSSIGLIGAALIVILKSLVGEKFKSEIFEEYEEYTEKSRIKSGTKQAFGQAMREMRSDVDFEPYIDIIKGSNMKMKQRAIAKLSKLASKDSVKLLKEAVKDPSPEIRFYVAGAFSKIENDITEKIDSASERVKERASSKDFAYLGDLYRLYAEIGILPENLSKYYLSLSCKAYQSSIDMETDQEEVMVSYIQCLMILKRFIKAKALLDSASRIWPGNNEVLFLRGYASFELKCFEDIEKSFNNIDIDEISEKRKEIVEIWKTEKQETTI